jgi:hypothetical protein
VGTPEEEFLLRVDGTDLVTKESRNSSQEFRYTESHPSHMEDTMWSNKLELWVREQLEYRLLVPFKDITDRSSLYQQIRHLAALVPTLPIEDVFKYRGIENVPNYEEKLADKNPPVVSLIRALASTELHSLLVLTLKYTDVFREVFDRIRPLEKDGHNIRPIATMYNLLQLVCDYSGFIQPSLHGTTIVIDDQRLPGLNGQALFKQQADNPGMFRVWYTTAAPSSGFPCRVCRVQEYQGTNRLVDVDHTSPTVIDRLFRRYAVLWTHVIHTQAHHANVYAAQITKTHLDMNDPLRKLISVCTSNTILEDVVGQRIFFNPAPRIESFSPFKWLSKETWEKKLNVRTSDVYPTLGNYPVMALEMTYNISTHRQHIPSGSLIFVLSPVMQALRKFGDIIHATCCRLSTLSPADTYRDRQTLVNAYNACEIPCIRSMPVSDGFEILENVIRMVAQHHYTHTRYIHDSSQTSSLVWSAVDKGETSAFGTPFATGVVPQMKMQFGKNFPAALVAEPVLRDTVAWMLIQLERLEHDCRRSGINIFSDLTSGITV